MSAPSNVRRFDSLNIHIVSPWKTPHNLADEVNSGVSQDHQARGNGARALHNREHPCYHLNMEVTIPATGNPVPQPPESVCLRPFPLHRWPRSGPQVGTLSYEVEQEWGILEQILGATASQTHGSGSGIDSPHAYWLLSRVPVASSLGVDP